MNTNSPIESRSAPVALILTRQDVPTLDRTRFAAAEGLRRGAYILADAPGANLILIATGSEVGLIVAAAEQLRARNLASRDAAPVVEEAPKAAAKKAPAKKKAAPAAEAEVSGDEA